MEHDSARVLLKMPADVHEQVWEHLLCDDIKAESAAFMFVPHESRGELHTFTHLEWYPVPAHGYRSRTSKHFELADFVRADVIKRAHDLGASIVEFHSHLGMRPAEFSRSDYFGFREFVPHVWWRLRGRSYLAIVVTQADFDGLAWIDGPSDPWHVDAVSVGELSLYPTKISSLNGPSYAQ